MLRFGSVYVLDELNGNQINRRQNLMSLGISAHADFDSLEIWFEPLVEKGVAVSSISKFCLIPAEN